MSAFESRAAGCESKVSFANKALATASRQHTSRTVYRCAFCSQWHVGNTGHRPAAAASARAQTLFNIRALEALTAY